MENFRKTGGIELKEIADVRKGDNRFNQLVKFLQNRLTNAEFIEILCKDRDASASSSVAPAPQSSVASATEEHADVSSSSSSFTSSPSLSSLSSSSSSSSDDEDDESEDIVTKDTEIGELLSKDLMAKKAVRIVDNFVSLKTLTEILEPYNLFLGFKAGVTVKDGLSKTKNLISRSYVCGYCSHSVTSARGLSAHLQEHHEHKYAVVCGFCSKVVGYSRKYVWEHLRNDDKKNPKPGNYNQLCEKLKIDANNVRERMVEDAKKNKMKKKMRREKRREMKRARKERRRR